MTVFLKVTINKSVLEFKLDL